MAREDVINRHHTMDPKPQETKSMSQSQKTTTTKESKTVPVWFSLPKYG